MTRLLSSLKVFGIKICLNLILILYVSDIQDVERLCPGLLKATVEWYRIYKIPDGKPENKFAFNGEAKNREFALHVIEDVHKFWQALHSKEADAGGICLYVLLYCILTAVAVA
jgi:nucleosome-remodeling factor 38 kDa subunit